MHIARHIPTSRLHPYRIQDVLLHEHVHDVDVSCMNASFPLLHAAASFIMCYGGCVLYAVPVCSCVSWNVYADAFDFFAFDAEDMMRTDTWQEEEDV